MVHLTFRNQCSHPPKHFGAERSRAWRGSRIYFLATNTSRVSSIIVETLNTKESKSRYLRWEENKEREKEKKEQSY